MSDQVAAELETLAASALASPAPEAAMAIARLIFAQHGDSVTAVLFYGACRRDGDGTGLLDIYVLYDRHRAFHRSAVLAALTAMLPPHVVFLRAGSATAKVAALSRTQFARRVLPGSLDTTIWARFSQPATLLYARDVEARRWVAVTLARTVQTAVIWAWRLGPAGGGPAECWQALFARTYGAELRPERGNRPALIYGADRPWFDTAFGLVQPGPHRRWRAAWLVRRIYGKPLNLMRLVKAAMTFENGTDYLLAKLARHGAVRIVPSDWQRRHPLLAAPVLLWRIRTKR